MFAAKQAGQPITHQFSFKYSRSVQPAVNDNLYITNNIKKHFLANEFQPAHQLLTQLDTGYGTGDLLCDAWLADASKLPAKGMSLVRQALAQGIASVENAPESLKALFYQVENTPDWVDYDLMLCGSKTLERYPVIQGLMLQSVALMGGYSVPALAEPLLKTNALAASTVSRMARTLGFLAAVTIPHGLKFRQVGFKQAVHVRMVHGLVRQNLMQSGKWDFQRFGLPINQSDLIATNLVFSLLVIHGLLAFNCHISQKERLGILHLWRYTAFLLGIDDERLPKTEQESNEWLYAYLVTQKMDAVNTQPLAKALHGLPLAIEHTAFKQKAKAEQAIRASVTRYFWGDAICDDLGLPRSRWANATIKAVQHTQHTSDQLRSRIKPVAWLMNMGADKYRNHVKTQFVLAKPELKPFFEEIEAFYHQHAG